MFISYLSRIDFKITESQNYFRRFIILTQWMLPPSAKRDKMPFKPAKTDKETFS